MAPRTARAERRLDVPVSLAYALVCDLSLQPRWRPGVRSASVAPAGATREGTKAVVQLEHGVERWTITHADAPWRIDAEVQRPDLGATAQRIHFENGRVVHEVDLELRGVRRLAPGYNVQKIEHQLAEELDALARHLA